MNNTPSILLVDDDERLRTAAGKVLAAGGYRVVSAASGREALENLKEVEPSRWWSAICACRTWTALRC